MTELCKRIGVLASGGGTNMQAIMDEIGTGKINGKITLVISDNPDAYALERAKSAQIDTAVVSPKDYASREDFCRELANRFSAASCDLLVLAGFMRVITRELIVPFAGRMMNIHPSLVPSFCGPGFFGHHVHEAVLSYGTKVSGCTVHFVEEAVDGGPIIIQHVVPVLDDDTPDTLAARVLIEEHKAFPEAVRLFCADRLRLEGRLVRILPA